VSSPYGSRGAALNDRKMKEEKKRGKKPKPTGMKRDDGAKLKGDSEQKKEKGRRSVYEKEIKERRTNLDGGTGVKKVQKKKKQGPKQVAGSFGSGLYTGETCLKGKKLNRGRRRGGKKHNPKIRTKLGSEKRKDALDPQDGAAIITNNGTTRSFSADRGLPKRLQQ